MPGVTNAFGTFGSYDILAKLESSNEQSIRNDISDGIRKIPSVIETLTLLVDENHGTTKANECEREVSDTCMAHAFVAIRCSKPNESKTLRSLDGIPEIVGADALVGKYDVICRIAAPTYNDISGIVGKKIRKMPGIKSTVTINVICNQGFDRL